ncbi:hypothetical protein [Nostoc sp. 'Peltigera membranacea cyanobiont' 210A]|uniref:hypothetical protein n=1 Tax=Nostoc sp. 'Peltigera membranacea cyanobiont' 210A TaxID=2014529 RepID=UPI00167EF976|nr:hypothetical protein [Nostoc sp. 'Peltigera membranacea cyanobiont' 210A]
MAKDAMHRVSTNGLFVAFFFQIGIILCDRTFKNSIILGNGCGECSDRYFPPWDYKIY